MKKRVVVTGVGVVAPNGVGKDAFWQALIQGLSGVRTLRRFDPSPFNCHIGGEVTGLDPLCYCEPKELKKLDRSNLYAIAAGVMALEDSGMDLSTENRERIGSAIGNSLGGVEYVDKEIDVLRDKGPRWGSPYLAIAFFSCGSNGLLSIRLGLKGVVLTLCNGNTSGTDALGMGYRTIQSGKADVMLAGGTEAPLVPLFFGSLSKDGFLSQRNADPEKASRPFDLSADGMVLSEGAALLVLESLEHAQARGARIYAEVTGYASGNSAFDVLKPEPSGKSLTSTLRRSLDEAHLRPEEVDVMQLQGLSMPAYDNMEAHCLHQTFGDSGHAPRLSAVSSTLGNSLGALGAFQAAASVLMLERQGVPALPVYEHANRIFVRPPDATDPKPIDVIVQNSYCFLGKSSALVLRRYR
jgi:3-oxoacyl-[acyl-carrier-protein] synthase II